MNWKALGPLLGVILLAALAFAFWPEVPPPVSASPTTSVPAFQPSKVVRQVPVRNETAASDAAVVVIGGLIPLPPSNAAANGEPQLDAVADPERLRELGVAEDAIEPADGGVLLKLDRAAIKSAMDGKREALKACWHGTATAKVKLEFQLVEIPGRGRAKIGAVEAVDAGRAFEACAREAVKELRFETPRGGETRVTYLLHEKAATP